MGQSLLQVCGGELFQEENSFCVKNCGYFEFLLGTKLSTAVCKGFYDEIKKTR